MTTSMAPPSGMAFGIDADGYRRWRPEYPQTVFDTIDAYQGRPVERLFEVGAGAGLATAPLLGRGHHTLTAIEPDPALAALLPHTLDVQQRQRLTLLASRFDVAPDPSLPYDGGRAAMVMHWLDPSDALPRARRWLRRVGCWAMWWNVLGSWQQPYDFMQASSPLFAWLGDGTPPRVPHALQREACINDLAAAGFVNIEHSCVQWTCRQTTEQVIGLSATFPQVIALPETARQSFLQRLANLVHTRFGGSVERHFLTPLYLATAP